MYRQDLSNFILASILVIFGLYSILVAGDLCASDVASTGDLYSTYKSNDFFKLDTVLPHADLDDAQRTFFQGQLDAAFLRDAKATNKLSRFLEFPNVAAEWKKEAWLTLGHCRLRTGEYEIAAQNFARVLAEYGMMCTQTEKKEIEQNLATATTLKNTPPQTSSGLSGVSTVNVTHGISGIDYGGFTYIDVRVNGFTEEVLFDTSANVNVASETYAKRHKLHVLPDHLSITSAMGDAVPVQLAIADEVQIGKFMFHNVIFSVVKDEDLALPDSHLAFVAIIGSPLIIPLGNIRVDISENKMEVGRNADSPTITKPIKRNLAYCHQFPVITVEYQNNSVPFLMDTGADRTILFRKFSELFPQLFIGINESKEHRNGIGGRKSVTTKIIPELELHVNNVPRFLRRVTTLTDDPLFLPVAFGIVGADFLSGGYEIDFQQMQFSLLQQQR